MPLWEPRLAGADLDDASEQLDGLVVAKRLVPYEPLPRELQVERVKAAS